MKKRLARWKRGELTATEVAGIIIVLAFLLWGLLFSNSIRGKIGDAFDTLFGIFR